MLKILTPRDELWGCQGELKGNRLNRKNKGEC